MATTLEAADTQIPNTFNLGDFLRQLFSHLGILLSLAAVLALGVGVTLWSIKPEYTPVYSNLTQADALGWWLMCYVLQISHFDLTHPME